MRQYNNISVVNVFRLLYDTKKERGNHMPRKAVIHARTEQELKNEVEGILKTLGLSTTEAVNIFFNQIRLRRGLPFPVEIPNEETLKTFRDSEAGKGLIECKDADDMFKKLGV